LLVKSSVAALQNQPLQVLANCMPLLVLKSQLASQATQLNPILLLGKLSVLKTICLTSSTGPQEKAFGKGPRHAEISRESFLFSLR